MERKTIKSKGSKRRKIKRKKDKKCN